VQGMWSAISDSILFFAVFLVSQRWLALFTVSARIRWTGMGRARRHILQSRSAADNMSFVTFLGPAVSEITDSEDELELDRTWR